MISVKEALKIVEENAFIPNVSEVSLLESVGKVLAEDIIADRDFPPFDRVAMDGIVINQKSEVFKIEATQYAGEAQKSLENPENCMEVMTGAVLPLGCHTVIRYEDVDIQEVDGVKMAKITIPLSEISQGQNVHRQGSDRKMGDILLQKGLKISPSEIAVMASVGKASVKVEIPPKVAVISTGDELVEITANPLPYQIRMSNSYMLSAALERVGVKANLFHLTDDKELLFSKLKEVLSNHDVILLSGGVSAGKKDFVPEILTDLGVKKLFHKVAQKPGKPFWFGKTDEGKTVFALPGNPVSTFLCFCKYFLERKNEVVVLDKDVSFKPNLTYFVPVKTYFQDGRLMATPFEGSGSADFANLTDCDGFVELPADSQVFKKGEFFEFVRFRF
ncbi:molybdopterin molybdotransferase MoeA [Arcicella sp. LKC2W]|uniref:molybdopterin molybdotransferase MoeA n=1 Tax=Arcicella sp. LKC2W TaxID=2984198 RepID=UPI002B22154D|nr:molybdopterin molybdotransferase MoeA [Arcicella sp. LKC2W]MEA5461037.1 molybdopterin molybdotransferase MoeA [Arcicella sp. LKC2W]